jgi:mono/diheme cytochrome c family protein
LKNRVPVVFDAGTNDPTSDTFAPAFDVIRQFNEEALLQNMSVHADSFETEAARIWLTLHATANAPQPPIRRSFTRNGATAWQASEAEGLARLNRYCFRCHGSVRFSIFDRQTVVENAGVLRQRIAPSAAQLRIPGFKMPPDRTLDDGEIQALDSFLRNLR